MMTPPLKDSYITPLPQHTHTLNQDWEFIVNNKLLILCVYVCVALCWTEYKGVCEWRRGGGEERKIKIRARESRTTEQQKHEKNFVVSV